MRHSVDTPERQKTTEETRSIANKTSPCLVRLLRPPPKDTDALFLQLQPRSPHGALNIIQELILDDIRERDVTDHSICVYLFTNKLRHTCTSGIFYYLITRICYTSNVRRFTKCALPILLLSTFRVSNMNYYHVCSLPIHEIRALCRIFSAISVPAHWPWKTPMTLESGFWMGQGYRKLHQ